MGKKSKKEKLKFRPLALRLGDLRKQRNLSQAELGDRLDTSDASIARIEGGKQNWNQEFLQAAAEELDVHWLELLPIQGSGDVLGLWADIPEHDRGRALAALRIFTRRSVAS